MYPCANGRLILWIMIFTRSNLAQELNTFRPVITCDTQTDKCTDDKVFPPCRITRLEDIDLRSGYLSDLRWTMDAGPSEPSPPLVETSIVNNTVHLTLRWNGPDDSSNRDLSGFDIILADGLATYEFFMDLRTDEEFKGNFSATMIFYQFRCSFSTSDCMDEVTLIVVSLPKPRQGIDKKATAVWKHPCGDVLHPNNFTATHPTVKTKKYTSNQSDGAPDSKSSFVLAAVLTGIIPVIVGAVILCGIIRYKRRTTEKKEKSSKNVAKEDERVSSKGDHSDTPMNDDHYVSYLKIKTFHHLYDLHLPSAINNYNAAEENVTNPDLREQDSTDIWDNTTLYFRGPDYSLPCAKCENSTPTTTDSGLSMDIPDSDLADTEGDFNYGFLGKEREAFRSSSGFFRFVEPDHFPDNMSCTTDDLEAQIMKVNHTVL